MSISASCARPVRRPPSSKVAILLGCDCATASALPLTIGGGGKATNDLEIDGALSDEAVFTVSLGST